MYICIYVYIYIWSVGTSNLGFWRPSAAVFPRPSNLVERAQVDRQVMKLQDKGRKYKVQICITIYYKPKNKLFGILAISR